MNKNHSLLTRRVALGLFVIAVMMSAGCDAPRSNTGQTSLFTNPDGSNGVSMGPPAEWLSFRSVDPDTLQLVFTLDGARQDSSRRENNQWTASFTLPDDNDHTIQATWQEQLPDRTMTLAVSDALTINNQQRQRSLTISTYQHRAFDEDNDGISNLDERRLDLEPLVANPVTPGEDQSDCRANTTSINFGEFFATVTNPNFAPPQRVASTISVTNIDSAMTETGLAVFEAFSVLTPGSLTVTHTGGSISTGAFLYDTSTNNTPRLLARDNIPTVGSGSGFENRLAIITVDVQPGLYCFRVESTVDNQPLINPGLQYSFVADSERSAANLPTTRTVPTSRTALIGDEIMSSKD